MQPKLWIEKNVHMAIREKLITNQKSYVLKMSKMLNGVIDINYGGGYKKNCYKLVLDEDILNAGSK